MGLYALYGTPFRSRCRKGARSGNLGFCALAGGRGSTLRRGAHDLWPHLWILTEDTPGRCRGGSEGGGGSGMQRGLRGKSGSAGRQGKALSNEVPRQHVGSWEC